MFNEDMHYVAFAILPPGDVEDVPNDLAKLMEPHREDYDYDNNERSGFWDWYVVGGRWNDRFGSRSVITPGEVLATPAPDGLCWSVITGELVEHKQIYHDDRDYPECLEEVPDFPQRLQRIMRAVHPDSRVVVVDYHS